MDGALADSLCPLHETPEPFALFRLTRGALETALDRGDAAPIEVVRAGVSVCPACGFAAIDPRMFPNAGTGGPPPIALPPEAAARCFADRERRMAAAGRGAVGGGAGRDSRAALVAFSLALACAETLHAAGGGDFLLAHGASCHLAIARLSADLGLDAAVEGHLVRAQTTLARAAARCGGSLRARALFRQGAVSLRLGDAGQAQRAFAALRRLAGSDLSAGAGDEAADPVPADQRPALLAALIEAAERLRPGRPA